MKEKEINITYSTIQSNSFSFTKSRDLKHIKVSKMKFVKGKFVKQTACGRNLVEPVDFPNQIKETKFQKELDIALRPLDPASAGLAKAYVIETLEEIVQEGDIEDLPFYQDISDKVADILEDPEELEFFLNKVEGASPAEISSIVTDYLKKKFPKKFEDMQTEIRRKATIETTRQGALANIAASTNAARGRAAFEAGMIDEDRPLTPDDEGYFDLSNPDDADRALMLYEREENKKRKARQKKEQLSATTGVGLTSRSGFNL